MTGHTALIARLRLLNNPAVRKRTMEFWDSWRRAIADGESGSWPRDAFEGILDEFVEMGGDAADALERMEPPLTCPLIDAFIAKHNPPADVIEELAQIRDTNSQLRYGLWHERTRAEEAEAKLAALTDALEAAEKVIGPFAKIADTWTVQNAAKTGALLTISNGERMRGMDARDLIAALAWRDKYGSRT